MCVTVILSWHNSAYLHVCGFAYVGTAEGQRGETDCFKGAVEGMAETETRLGESQAAGGAHPQEGKTQEGDGETQIRFIAVTNMNQKPHTSTQ